MNDEFFLTGQSAHQDAEKYRLALFDHKWTVREKQGRAGVTGFSPRTELSLFCVLGSHLTSWKRQTHLCLVRGNLRPGQELWSGEFNEHMAFELQVGETSLARALWRYKYRKGSRGERCKEREALCLGLESIQNRTVLAFDITEHTSQWVKLFIQTILARNRTTKC